MAEGVDNTISGGSDRIERIARELREAPQRCVVVALTLYPNTSAELARWERSEWTDLLAHDVEAEMVAHHEAAETSDSKYALRFFDDKGHQKKQREFCVRTRANLSDRDNVPMGNLNLDGTAPAGNALMQNGLFAVMRLYHTSMMQVVKTANESLQQQQSLVGSLVELVKTSEARAASYQDELQTLREMVVELKMREPEPVELTPAQAQWFELATKALPELQGLARVALMKWGAAS